MSNCRKRIIYIALLFSITFLPGFRSVINAQTLVVEHPDLLSKKPISLNCKWEFFPNEFIEPGDKTTICRHLVNIPSSWNNYNLGGVFDKGKGAGSFRLRITNLKPYEQYAFSIYDIAATSMRIYANEQKLITVGQPSLNPDETIADQQMGVVSFKADRNGVVELLFHVSNKFHRSGGIWTGITFGEKSFIRRSYNREQNITFLFLGALFTVFLYQLLLFFFYNRNLGNLSLAFFSFAIFSRILATPFCVLKLYLPNIPYEALLRIEYSAMFIGPVFFQLYVWKLTDKLFPKLAVKIVTGIGICLACIVFLTPIYVGVRAVLPCQIFMVVTTVYVVTTMIVQYIRKHTRILGLVLLSLVLILVGTIHDICAIYFIPVFLPDWSLIPYAFILFVFFQIAITAHQFEQSQNAVDKLSDTLVETNKAYYRFVPREFLSLLSKKNIVDVHLGEWITRDMTLLCADIRNFTTISESIDGKAVFDLLNRYLMRIAPIIRNNNGFIEKYLGDGIIALFPDDGKSAFTCAVTMQKEIADLRKKLVIEGLPRIDIGIGLHYGRIVLGTVGEKDRMNEITLSKAIETVMSLEALTKSYKAPIIASKTAVEQWNTRNDFTIQQLDQAPALERNVKESVFSVNADSLEKLP